MKNLIIISPGKLSLVVKVNVVTPEGVVVVVVFGLYLTIANKPLYIGWRFDISQTR